MRRNFLRISTQIEKRIAEGRGQGEGDDYKPWITVHDFPSRGRIHRIKGWKHGRVHHLLSDLEANFFYAFEWSPMITEIREQYPLFPLEETITIAERLGIKHPTDTRTGKPVIMTTDFFLTIKCKLKSKYQAITAKYSSGLASKRTLEKLKIEQHYWSSRNIDWSIVTEQELPTVLIENVKWLHPYFRLVDLYPLNERQVNEIASLLRLVMTNNSSPLRDITRSCDAELGLAQGTSLAVVRHLLAKDFWRIDMSQPIRQSAPLVLRNTSRSIIYYERSVIS